MTESARQFAAAKTEAEAAEGGGGRVAAMADVVGCAKNVGCGWGGAAWQWRAAMMMAELKGGVVATATQ